MRCVWCGSETSTRKDGKVFFCVECNKPLVFELEDDYAEVVKASDFRLPQQPLQQQQQQQPQQQHRQQLQRLQKQQPQKQPRQQQHRQQREQPQQQSQLRAQQPRQGQQQKRGRGQTTLNWWFATVTDKFI